MTERLVPFVDHGKTQQSANEGGPKLVVGTDAKKTGLGQMATGERGGRFFLAVFAGAKRTGGFAVEVDRVARDGDRLAIHASFAEPPRNAVVIQVLTSPAQLVSIDRRQALGVRVAVLIDGSGIERARLAVPQSEL